MVRDNRRLFLSKEAWKKFRGYAQAQLKKMNDKQPEGKRKEIVDRYGFDVKFAYHIIRLMDEAEQILLDGDLDLEGKGTDEGDPQRRLDRRRGA